MDDIEGILDTVKMDTQYRNGNKKDTFHWDFSMQIGRTTNALGAAKGAFNTRHHFEKGRGVYMGNIEDRKIPKWKLNLWKKSKRIIQLIDPDFAANDDFVVQYARMSNPNHHCKKHVDALDVSHQYALALGNYRGAKLRVYDAQDKPTGEYDYKRKILKFDGRLPHELVMDDFQGTRYSLVFFKMYDRRQTERAPIFHTPTFVY